MDPEIRPGQAPESVLVADNGEAGFRAHRDPEPRMEP
jgi:hypothetical protein